MKLSRENTNKINTTGLASLQRQGIRRIEFGQKTTCTCTIDHSHLYIKHANHHLDMIYTSSTCIVQQLKRMIYALCTLKKEEVMEAQCERGSNERVSIKSCLRNGVRSGEESLHTNSHCRCQLMTHSSECSGYELVVLPPDCYPYCSNWWAGASLDVR